MSVASEHSTRDCRRLPGVGGPAWLRRPTTVGLVFLVLVLVVYLPGILNGTFHFDDFHHVRDNPAVRDAGNLLGLRYFVDPTLWSGEPGNVMYRPFGMLPHALDFQVWQAVTGDGYHAPGWVLTNALLHATVAILVWRLAVRLGLSHAAAFLAGLLMALHPVHSEVVCYISARSESVAAIAFISALLVHLRARDATPGRRVAGFVLAGVLYALAMTAKETAALFFVAVAWMELVTTRGPWSRRFGRAALAGVVYGAFFGAIMLLRREMISHAVPPIRFIQPNEGADPQVGGGRTYVQNWLTQSRVVVLYFQLLLRPVRLTVDHDVRVLLGMTAAAAAAITLHLGVAAAAIRSLFRGRRLVPLCIGWFWLLLAPSIVVPLNVVMNEHRLYLPGIAVALLGGAALERVHRVLSARAGVVRASLALALPFACFVAAIVDRSTEWRDDFSLWSAAVERAPESARAHMHLGAAFHQQAKAAAGDEALDLYDAALSEYAIAGRLHPDWYDLSLNVGGAWLERGRLTGEREDFERALAAYEHSGVIVGPTKERPRYLQAAAHTELGRFDASHYARSIELMTELDEQDESVTTLYDHALARTYHVMGDNAAAAAAMGRVIAIEEPDGKIDGMLTLGWWFFEDGDLQRSQELLTRALEIARAVGETDLGDARRRRLFRAHLYVARFLNIVGQPDPSFIEGARKLGWTAPPAEVEWVRGGPTPGARTSLRRPGPRR